MTKIRVLAILSAALLIAPPPYLFAQQPQQPIKQHASTGVLSPDQLDSLGAPLALYPDPILSQVLVATTNLSKSWKRGSGLSSTPRSLVRH